MKKKTPDYYKNTIAYSGLRRCMMVGSELAVRTIKPCCLEISGKNGKYFAEYLASSMLKFSSS